jgi:hypothetical protein
MNTRLNPQDRDRLKALEMEIEGLKKENETLKKEFERELLRLEARMLKDEEDLKREVDDTKKIVLMLDNQAKSAKIIFVFLAIVGGFLTWVLDIGSKLSAFIKQ